jgi:hypothetical protein
MKKLLEIVYDLLIEAIQLSSFVILSRFRRNWKIVS